MYLSQCKGFIHIGNQQFVIEKKLRFIIIVHIPPQPSQRGMSKASKRIRLREPAKSSRSWYTLTSFRRFLFDMSLVHVSGSLVSGLR
mmetsp:Transcript_10195/g.17061  ORF Transcript_10195/g.17061 Transcript_10195/m.17061 type:complete len:87 (+) Transcript_10195:180-440(+)